VTGPGTLDPEEAADADPGAGDSATEDRTAADPSLDHRPTAAIGDVGRAFIRATMRAEIAGIAIAVVVAPLLSIVLNLAIAGTPLVDLWSTFPLSWLSLSTIAFVLLLGVTWTVAAIALIPRAVRPGMETFTWAGERSLEAMRATTGGEEAPATPGAARRWLAAHPETPENRWIRAEALLLAGEGDEARATVGRMTGDTPVERWQREDTRATVDLVTTGTVDLTGYRAALAELDAEAAIDAEAGLAIMEARLALLAGGDWLGPLTELRPRIGGDADGILWRRYAVRRLRAALPIMALVAVLFGLVTVLADAASR
jgi:hypothetical protein